MREIGLNIRNGLMTIDEAKELKRKMKNNIDKLKIHSAKTDDTKNKKIKTLKMLSYLIME